MSSNNGDPFAPTEGIFSSEPNNTSTIFPDFSTFGSDPMAFTTIQSSNPTPPTSAGIKVPTSGIVSPAPPLLIVPGLTGNINTNSNSIVNTNNAATAAYKITQLGPVAGCNVVVSRMDQRPSSVVNTQADPSNIYNAAATRVQQSQRLPPPPGTAKYTNNYGSYYHSNPHNLVTKFTNMTVSNAGGKNPLKPTHYTVSNGPVDGQSTFINSAPNANQQQQPAPQVPRTALKASDLIHILPNLVNTLKRRHSQSGQPGNSLAAAVAAAAASSQSSSNAKSAAALVAEQLLNVAAGKLSADEMGSPPQGKRMRIHNMSAQHQCEVCGKVYKHRNCLSKHRWEHHDAWEHTKKVCQTKHQQVQLLEAAQVLAEIMLGVQPGHRRHLESDDNGDDNEGDELIDIDEGLGSVNKNNEALPV